MISTRSFFLIAWSEIEEAINYVLKGNTEKNLSSVCDVSELVINVNYTSYHNVGETLYMGLLLCLKA